MKLPSIKKILTETFPDLKWMPQLLSPLNQFMEQIVQGLNRGLTISENFDAVVKTIELDGTWPAKFKWERTNRPTVAFVGYVREKTGAHTERHGFYALDSEESSGGSTSENLDVSGLLSSDTVLAVTQKTKGTNTVALVAYDDPTDGHIVARWTADPGAGAVIRVLVERGGSPIDLDWEYTGDGFFRINGMPGLKPSSTNKFLATIVAFAEKGN